MIFSKIHSAQPNILKAEGVDIESDISNGLHSFSIVGLTDKSIEESKERVSSAIKNSRFNAPKQQNHKITILLSPANIKKSGSIFDLPIALAYLKSSEQVKFNPKDKIFVGELSLDGKIKRVKGIIQIILHAKDNNFKEVYIPKENQLEASIIKGIEIFCVEDLRQLVSHLQFKKKIIATKNKSLTLSNKINFDFSQIKGNEQSKRALLIAASGGHNICLHGPPGTGKTMLTKAFCEILPNLSYKEIIETSAIQSLVENKGLVTKPPLRKPHHTASYSSIIGGNAIGEITLAHNGVLLMDEFPEFNRRTIESLRQPMEEKVIRISRVNKRIIYPCNFKLVATLNPCPCGFKNSDKKECKCSVREIENYKKKLSGPVMERIDIFSEVSNIDYQKLFKKNESQSLKMKEIVKNCQLKQIKRCGKLNDDLESDEIQSFVKNSPLINEFNNIANKLNISARSYFKIFKVARTIADIENSRQIKKPHLLEALQYRNNLEY